ncbi:hypothetical protein OsI_03187 [Oryza sativa Indica Group]|uniref:Cytochrome b561 domain-containing protein n=1 Tax=Oryza sativa subsp. indica TaxID=39946 RepID=A2WTK0_ORYSI|nr:hypothetical protein OsI_03187 [Oryza sativa Indica Group]
MFVSARKRLFFLFISSLLLLLLAPSDGSSNSTTNLNQSHNKTGRIILARMSSKSKSGRSIRVLFYCHVISQIAAVLLATGGAALSLMNFENSFSNSHQRVGLALYGFMWLQPLIGFFRPERGVKVRSLWYFLHWLLGIAICATGITNVYIGLHTYHERTTKSVKLWTGLLTFELSLLLFFYLLIDRWSYMMKQGNAPIELV